MKKGFLMIFSLLLTIILMCSCGSKSKLATSNQERNEEDEQTSSVESSISIIITPAALDMPIGRTISLQAESDSDKPVTWSSSNEAIASVSSDGKVTSHTLGEAFVIATIDSISTQSRISVIDGSIALAYEKDPGAISELGSDRIPTNDDSDDSNQNNPTEDDPNNDNDDSNNKDENNNTEDNIPIVVPEDQEEVPFVDEYVWTINIEDGFEAELKMPEMPGYLVRNDVKLLAQKLEGESIYGEYKGTIEFHTKINEQSFINAMNSFAPDAPITSFSSEVNIQTAEVTFTVVPYDSDALTNANTTFATQNTPPMIQPLVTPRGMTISSYKTTASQTISLTAEDGYGSSSGSGGAETPFLIRIDTTGGATLYLPRMLMAYQYNTFSGKIYKSPKQ